MSSSDRSVCPPRTGDLAVAENYLLVESDRDVRRLPFTAELTRLGSAPDDHVILSAPGVVAAHAQVKSRGQSFHLVPRAGAPVQLNGRAVSRATPLSSGDRIGLGQAVVVFARAPAGNRSRRKTYVVVERADGFVLNCAVQHTVIWVGRTHGELLVMDDELAGRHFAIESYGPDAVYVYNERETAPVTLYGERVVGRRRVFNGGTATAGSTRFTVFGRPHGAVERPPWATHADRAAEPRPLAAACREDRPAPATTSAPGNAVGGPHEDETVILDADLGDETVILDADLGDETVLPECPGERDTVPDAPRGLPVGQQGETMLLDAPVTGPDAGHGPTAGDDARATPASPYLHDQAPEQRSGDPAPGERYRPRGDNAPDGTTRELASTPKREEERYLP